VAARYPIKISRRRLATNVVASADSRCGAITIGEVRNPLLPYPNSSFLAAQATAASVHLLTDGHHRLSGSSALSADAPVSKPEPHEARRSGCSSRSTTSGASAPKPTRQFRRSGPRAPEAEKRNRIGCPPARRSATARRFGTPRPYCLQETINESSWSIVNLD
jgi:hypothetical protein